MDKLKSGFKKVFAPAALGAAGTVGAKLLAIFTGIFAAALIIYSGYVLYHTFYTQNQAFTSTWDVQKYKPPVVEEQEPGAEDFSAINPDYRAWLTLYDTSIDHPVVQGNDELYYASHDAYGEVSLAGAIYLSAGNTRDLTDKYNLIYGHHMDNGAMFGALDKYLDEDYILSHKFGILIGKEARYPLEVFAVIITDAYESQIYTTGPQRTVEEIIYFLTHPSDSTTVRWYDEEAASRAWKITALSTCMNAETNGRLVVLCMTPEDAVTTPAPTAEPSATPEVPETPPPSEPPERIPVTEPEEHDFFDPDGQGRDVWALVNLICVILTGYLLCPLLHLKDKYKREKLMKQANETAAAAADPTDAVTYEKLDTFRKRFRFGAVGSTLSLIAAIVAFILTEDMRLPMVLIDRWTPLMLLILLVAWILDVRLARYREKQKDEKEKKA